MYKYKFLIKGINLKLTDNWFQIFESRKCVDVISLLFTKLTVLNRLFSVGGIKTRKYYDPEF